jgi:hypothetical protein
MTTAFAPLNRPKTIHAMAPRPQPRDVVIRHDPRSLA